MSTVHFLNVNPGDCSVIQHATGRCSVIDICCGYTKENRLLKAMLERERNFRRADYPTNPIDYIKRIGVSAIHRFIVTHPDMDHLDGLDALATTFDIVNFWDSGITREKPPFEGARYKEEDWDRYISLRDGTDGNTSVNAVAGNRFRYANKNEENGNDVDGLYILAPDEGLVRRAMETEDMNDASYVILYRSVGGRILFTGDAHDDTFDYVIKNYADDVRNCSVMIAPHHGRKSDREHDFLDVVNPGLTLFGYAPSDHLAYGAYSSRKLPVLTSNAMGDIVLDCENGTITVYVENPHEVQDKTKRNAQGYYLLGSITRK